MHDTAPDRHRSLFRATPVGNAPVDAGERVEDITARRVAGEALDASLLQKPFSPGSLAAAAQEALGAGARGIATDSRGTP